MAPARPPRSALPARAPWSRRAASVLVAVVAVSVVLPAPSAQAVSKTSLWSVMKASSSDYAATKPVWGAFPTADRVRWRSSFATATYWLEKARRRLNLADTQAEVDAVAPLVSRERTRARVFRTTTSLGAASFSARTTARATGQQAFTDRLSGALDSATYSERRDDAAAVAALAAQDKRRAWAALGGLTAPSPSRAKAAVPALTSGDRVTMPAGWVGVPGGCGVPAATSAWIGTAGQPGRHLWVSEADVAAAQDRLVDGVAAARAADTTLRRAADKLKSAITSDLTAVSTPLRMRSSRLGYEALMGDAAADSWLRQDLTSVLLPGPRSSNPLRDAISLEALATDLDWTGLDESPEAADADLREAMLVRWLGPLSCQFDDRDTSVVDNDNIAIVNDTAMLHAGLALAPTEPALAAGLARLGLVNVLQGATAMTADGGSFEGPSYWNLQARYLGAVYGTVEAVYGDTPPVTLPSAHRQADYAWNSVAADGSSLAFADALAKPDPLRPGLVTWLAHRTALPAAGALARTSLATPTEGFQLLWWPTDEALAAEAPPRTSSLFPRTGLAALQAGPTTAWLKGGSSKEEHAHLDLGSVGYDKYGIQWAVDPGQDDYSLPGYSSSYATSPRWTYWRVAARGHSTLRPTTGQPPLRSAPFTSFSPSSGFARVNLLGTMPGATAAYRAAALSPSGVLTVTDRVTSKLARSWAWGWVTDASVSVSGTGSSRSLVLTRDGHEVTILLRGLPPRSSVSVVSAPSSATGPTGLPLRAVSVVLGPTTSLTLTATVS